MELLAVHNLVYEMALLIGCFLSVGAVFGGHGHDSSHDHNLDHDAHGDSHSGHDHESKDSKNSDISVRSKLSQVSLGKFLFSVLGIGNMPIMLWLMIFNLFFGSIGMLTNLVFGPNLGFEIVGLLVSVPLAGFGALVFTSGTSHLFGRFVPTDETYAVKRKELVGCAGMLTLPASKETGLAQIYDRRGNLQQISVRTIEGELPKETKIIVIYFDEVGGFYVVIAD
ncbi:hypothetical protein A2318_01255 [Candidatus Uhrbacteria bacterium RIFOXYB2_FULL_45_11]|uniref:Inner membrane protein YqiJ N-terminal domain-containing protein n=1 Tax=Candidatus Uhrbacteria bacterium RIFOXYB2_FULL_45_11 TaxID=1802421 RepID=A0A1F7W5Z5_9BACT|nr:MAG: hypothetical protein A2318_01255 [Candidatus Uhrbacteria bacterium RIFOXYB2_FULL_45_11]